MIKGAGALIVIAGIIWVFWMTKVWLTKEKSNSKKKK